MNGIGQYLYYLFAAAGGATICIMLAPDGKNGGMRNHIRYAAGLCICVCLLLPLAKNLSPDKILSALEGDGTGVQDLPSYEEIASDYQVQKLEDALQEEIARQYGIGGVKVRIAIDRTDPENILITDVSLFFPLDAPHSQQESITSAVRGWLRLDDGRGDGS